MKSSTFDLISTIEKAASALRPLLLADGVDAPGVVPQDYPDAGMVIKALQAALSVVLPGRPAISAKYEQAGMQFQDDTFIISALKDIAKLLHAEVERAVPFRWTGAAACMSGNSERLDARSEADRVIAELLQEIPTVRKNVIEDIKAAYDGDPSALTYAEVQLAFPGVLAIASHRIAHELYNRSIPIVPRIMSEWTHTQTGIDIHPGAKIGEGFFIDHGTGVVIGETTRIGNRVKLYQGVTLGAKSFPLDEHGRPIKHIKRHPTVEDDVIVYANAIILGGDTVIGKGSTIGGGVFLMESVQPGSSVQAKRPELAIKQRS